MSSLYVDRQNADLEDEAGRLVVRVKGERIGTVPLASLERVVLRGGGRISARLLARLSEQGIGFLILSGRQLLPSVSLPSRKAGDVALRSAQHALLGDEPARARFACGLIRAKVQGQLRCLGELGGDGGKPVRDACLRLKGALGRLAGDPSVTREALLGIEGAAAVAYFAGLAALLPPAFGFRGRNRRPPRDPINACLSLAYTLLHADAARELAMKGLDPELGIFHEPFRERESLACDLAEPLRPAIDRWIVGQAREGRLRPDQFTTTAEACLLGKAARADFYRGWDVAAAP